MSKLTVDLDLVQKYNVPGPRYTSYPPATHFTEEVDRGALMDEIKRNGQSDRDLSLYFHLPFCETLCWFCGCTTVITKDKSKSALYLDTVEKEMDLMGGLLNPERKVVQIHLGGGTPTFLEPDELRRLGEMIHSRFSVADTVEAGVEIDPRRLTKEKIVALQDAGFNRASMGVQDNNPVVQKAVHRIQPLEMTAQAIDWLRECEFQSLNVDLIYGLPHQNVASFEQTLDEILALDPDRLAIFNYAHVPWIKPAQKILERATLPAPETKLEVLKLCIEKLTSEGYAYIGMDHFAKENDELAVAQREKTMQRNFQGYSTLGGVDIHAYGMSSVSQAGGAYWQNQKELPDYEAALERDELPICRGYLLTEDDKNRRQIIMRLMCDLGLDYAAMSNQLGEDFETAYQSEIESLDDMVDDGLVTRTSTGIGVTDVGRLLIRNIAMRFDGSRVPAEGKEPRFSKTI